MTSYQLGRMCGLKTTESLFADFYKNSAIMMVSTSWQDINQKMTSSHVNVATYSVF